MNSRSMIGTIRHCHMCPSVRLSVRLSRMHRVPLLTRFLRLL